MLFVSVKAKFDVTPESEIVLEDDQGAEIDSEVFPVLLEQISIPNICFFVKGEIIIENVPCQGSSVPQIIYGKIKLKTLPLSHS